MDIKSNIWKMYLYTFFISLSFFTPVIVLFWQDNGLSLTKIMLLQSIFSIAVVVLEIPTGYFADVFTRKRALVIASFSVFFSMLVYGFSSNFYQFLIAEILWAVGMSFISGTDSAFIYDTLKDIKREKEYKKIQGNVFYYGFIAMALAHISGGFIGKVNFRYTFFVTLPFLFLMIILSFTLKEPERHKLIFKKGYLSELLKIIKFSIIKNKKIRWLIIYSAVIVGFNGAVLWFYQPYMKLTGLDIVHFGFVFAAFQIVAAVSSKYAYNIETRLGRKHSLIMLVILIGISYLLMGHFVYLFSFSFAFIQQFVRGFYKPVITDYINNLISSDIRATVLSAHNLMGKLFYALIIPFIGYIADVYSLIQSLIVLGITSLIIGIIVLIILHKNKII